MNNYKELKEDTAVLLQRSGDADYITKIGVWINLAHTFLYNIYDYYTALQDIHNFTTVASQENYVMPNRFNKPLRIYDLTNKKKLRIDVEEKYFDVNVVNIADATEGIPDVVRLYGETGVQTPISTSGNTVQVKSSSSSDNNNPVVRIEGFINSARTIMGFENITVSSSSPTTAVAGTVTFYEITHVSKSIDTVGFITIENSSGVTLATMDDIDRVLRHKVMKLGLIPNSANSMRILFKKKHKKLVNDNDYPFTDADDFLKLEAAGYGMAQDREVESKAPTMWNKAKDALNSILTNENSNLGPSFQHKFITSFNQAHRT